MKFHKHSNYEDYLKAQVSANIIKQNIVWVSEKDIAMLCDYLRPMQPKQGLCHGTRNGVEQAYFSKYLDVAVLGTEISSFGVNYPNTIQWDFHEVKKEWLNNMDFIYSNSFDHSYNPVKCLNSWMSCLNPKGVCIIEWSQDSSESFSNNVDVFGASMDEYKRLFETNYMIVDVLTRDDYQPTDYSSEGKRWFFILKR